MPACHKSAAKRFLQTGAILAVLMLLEAGLVLACILCPGNRVLPLLSGIAAMWALVAFGFAFGRFYKHVIRPGTETEKIVQALARGDFPPVAPPRPREFFPELGRSVNLLRDRLQYLETTLREHRLIEQRARGDNDGIALQARVHSRILTRLYPPIALADGYLALADRDPSAVSSAAEQTAHALRRLDALTAALRANTGEGMECDFDLGLFLRDLDAAAQTYLRRRKMSLSCSFGAELPAALRGDPAWLDRMLKDLLRILACESDDGHRLKLACTADGGAVRFSLAAPSDNRLAAAYQQSRDADSGMPGEETPLTLLELRLAAARAEHRRAELAVEEYGESGSLIRLSLDGAWSVGHEAGHVGSTRFTESSRRAAPMLRHAAGPGLAVARDPGFAALLQARHPGTAWTAATPEHLPDGDGFSRIFAVVPAEIADRHLQKLENALCHAAGRGADVTVIDPGMHRRFRRHLRECGIRGIADMPPLDRADDRGSEERTRE